MPADVASIIPDQEEHGRRTSDVGRRTVEHLNPILVRVVRQELRSRSFISIFLLLLTAATIAAAVVAAMARNGASSNLGPGFFGLITFVWTFALGVVQPLGCFRAISTERNDDTWDLVELTGMKPIRVVGGLMLASLVQGMLYTSALAPFMVMAYLLRGLDLLAIVFALVIVPLGGVAASALAVFTASLSAHKAVRGTLGGLLSLGLIFLWLSSAVFWFNLDELGYFLEAIRRFETEAWTASAAIVNAWGVGLVLTLVLAATLLAHRARDRSFAPRLAWWGIYLNWWIWWGVMSIVLAVTDPGERFVSEGMMVWSVVGQVLALVYGFFAVTEDHELSPRQARAITHPPRWRAWLTSILGPGNARGTLGYLLMGTVSLVAGIVAWGMVGFVPEPHYFEFDSVMAVNASIFAWGAIILLCADRLCRGPLRTWFDTPVLRRGFTLLSVAFWCLVPWLVLWLCDVEFVDSWPSFTSPVATFFQIGEHGIQPALIPALVFWTVGGFALLKFLIQGLDLRIVTTRILARDEDRNPRGG